MKTILILGANSAMARAYVRKIANKQTQLVLASRNTKELEKTAGDIELRCQAPKPHVMAFDAISTDKHDEFFRDCLKKVEHIDEVYLFFGLLKDQKECEQDFIKANEMLTANYNGAISILELIAQHMEKNKKGLIVGISSVAGDRGRQSNYLYGSSKAGFTAYLQGLRNRLFHHGVHVLTARPGTVDTPMTSHLKKGLLFASPEVIANGLAKAVKKKKNDIYLPDYWKWIMLIIRSVPEGLFKKLKM